MGRRLAIGSFSLVLAITLLAATAQAGFRIGFYDPVYNTADRAVWLDRTLDEGGSIVRIMPAWSSIAPDSRPTGFAAADPADPAYRWEAADGAVRDAASRGLGILFSLSGAPPWAQGAHRPADAGGTWRPDPQELAAFATAAARRYSGRFPDPERPGESLPRVRYWQIWNEPNLTSNLSPQWVRSGKRYTAVSPGVYRDLLNAGYAAIKAVDKTNFVVAAGTAPFGDPTPGGRRIAPVDFWRKLYAKSVHLDAVSHHPYSVGGPERRALNPDDVAVPDLGKLKRVLRTAQRSGHVLPRGPKPFWVTEISWDSSPPDPYGVPEATHARWVAGALYELWRQGVSVVTWFQIRDQHPDPSYAATNQSGVFFEDGRPKLAATAFRFPFIAHRRNGRVAYWGRAPEKATILLQRRAPSGWRTVRAVKRRGDGLFHGTLSSRSTAFRAITGGQPSLVSRTRRPN